MYGRAELMFVSPAAPARWPKAIVMVENRDQVIEYTRLIANLAAELRTPQKVNVFGVFQR